MFHNKFVPVFDGHNDSLLRFFYRHKNRKSFFDRHEFGHIDFPRIVEANFIGGFFALFVPPVATSEKKQHKTSLSPALDPQYAYEIVCKMFEYLPNIIDHPQVLPIKTFCDVKRCLHESLLGIVLHLEGASAIKDFTVLETFYNKGLRSIGLVWSRPNQYGVGAPFAFPHSPNIGDGLTHLGKELIRHCNRLGIIVDLAHLNEKGFWDAVKTSTKPLVVTHAAVHDLCPSSRNLTAEQIKAVAASNGVVGINLGTMFLRRDGKIEANTSMEDILAHFQYILDLVGADHVAFGSDFDGVYISPQIRDVRGLQRILSGLYAKGYSREDLTKVAYKNWFRILENTL